MDLIEQLDSTGFHEYLNKYQNTICGRHPIGVLLHVRFNLYVLYYYAAILTVIFYTWIYQTIDAVRRKQASNMEMKFLNYAQSSQCLSANDSSVSYAAGVFNLSVP